MTKKELAKQALDRKIADYEKTNAYRNKEELDKATQALVEQVRMAQNVNLINATLSNEYLAKLEKKYTQSIHSEQFKEYREQVLNFNDDFITSRERLFRMRKTEKESTEKSMSKWKNEINKYSSNGSGYGGNTREELNKNVNNEMEREAEIIK